jgi:hypothetical protein
MTKEQAKDFLPFIQAWADGKDLQIKFIGTGKWEDINPKAFLVFDKDPSEYRIKPLELPVLPEGEEWHNPFNLTPEQVGYGWRLMLKSEREQLAELYMANSSNTTLTSQDWQCSLNHPREGEIKWTESEPNSSFGFFENYPYRTKLPLPEPAEEMTVGEIEKLLGKKIKIVKEN